MTIIIIPCLLLIIYEVIMLIINNRDYAPEREGERSSKKKKKSKSSGSHHHHSSDGEKVIKRVDEETYDEDMPPEREDIQVPMDPVKEEKFVEKQLRKANDKLITAVREETGAIDTDEIKLDSLKVEPEPVVRRTDILREAAQTMESYKDEAEKIAQGMRTVEPPITPETVKKPENAEKPAQKEFFAGFDTEAAKEPAPAPKPEERPSAPRSEKAAEKPIESPLGELSAARIDELIKLLEEEKKRLGDK